MAIHSQHGSYGHPDEGILGIEPGPLANWAAGELGPTQPDDGVCCRRIHSYAAWLDLIDIITWGPC